MHANAGSRSPRLSVSTLPRPGWHALTSPPVSYACELAQLTTTSSKFSAENTALQLQILILPTDGSATVLRGSEEPASYSTRRFSVDSRVSAIPHAQLCGEHGRGRARARGSIFLQSICWLRACTIVECHGGVICQRCLILQTTVRPRLAPPKENPAGKSSTLDDPRAIRRNALTVDELSLLLGPRLEPANDGQLGPTSSAAAAACGSCCRNRQSLTGSRLELLDFVGRHERRDACAGCRDGCRRRRGRRP